VDGLMYATQLYLEARTFKDLVVKAVHVMEEAANHLEPSDPVGVEIDMFLGKAMECLNQSGLSRGWTPRQT
jgi:hypothetical protein